MMNPLREPTSSLVDQTQPWFKRIHHVGIAVPDLDVAIATY